MAPEKTPKADPKEETAEGTKIDAEGKKSVGNKIGTFLYVSTQTSHLCRAYCRYCSKEGFDKTKRQASEAQKDLKKSVGLGHKPNVVPRGKGDINGEPRTIELGWHPVAGATGKWFAQKTFVGRGITEKVGKYPDPTQHWAVIVGDYVHQLWMVNHEDFCM
jgi:hypothetical protein